jgi:hypothetical protein
MSAVSAPAPAEAPVTPRYLTPKEAARYTSIAVKTLEYYRRVGLGPRFITAGRSILYDIADLDGYMAARKVNNTAQAVDMQKAGTAR